MGFKLGGSFNEMQNTVQHLRGALKRLHHSSDYDTRGAQRVDLQCWPLPAFTAETCRSFFLNPTIGGMRIACSLTELEQPPEVVPEDHV